MNQELGYNSYFSSIRVSWCHWTEIADMKPTEEKLSSKTLFGMQSVLSAQVTICY